jgi:hypothetical protein
MEGSRMEDLLQDARNMALSAMPLAAVEMMDIPEEEEGGPKATLVLRLMGSRLQVAEMEDRIRSQLAPEPAAVNRLEGDESLNYHRGLNRWEDGAELVARLALLPSELDVLLREAQGLRDLASTQGISGSPVSTSASNTKNGIKRPVNGRVACSAGIAMTRMVTTTSTWCRKKWPPPTMANSGLQRRPARSPSPRR